MTAQDWRQQTQAVFNSVWVFSPPLKMEMHVSSLEFIVLVPSDSLLRCFDSIQVIKTLSPSNRQCRNRSDVQWEWRCSWSLWHLPVSTVKCQQPRLQGYWPMDKPPKTQCKYCFWSTSTLNKLFDIFRNMLISFYCQELDEKSDTTDMSVGKLHVCS